VFTDYKNLVKNKNFAKLWASQVLSQLAINVMNSLFLVTLFEKTNSSLAVSLLWISYALPAIFFGPIGSAIVDFVDNKKILYTTNFIQFLIILAYAFLFKGSIFLAYVTVLGYSLVNQFYSPSELSSIPHFVAKKNLSNANSMFFLTQQSSLIFGFGFSSFLLRYLGFQISMIICASFLFFAFLSTYTLPNFKVSKGEDKFDKLISSFFVKIWEGYKLIKGNKYILSPFLLLISMQVSLAVVMVNVPIIAQNVFNISLPLVGFYMVVPAAVGAIISALYVPKFLKKGIRKIEMIEKATLGIIICLLLGAFVIPVFSIIYRHIFVFLMMIAMGVFFVGIIIPSQTFLQENTPEEFRGRVFGNLWFLVTIATIFPVLLSGTIADIFGARFLLFFLGGIFVWLYAFLKTTKRKLFVNSN
jgi:MFS transporter, DHA3 family, macrolide efflux protein